MRYATTIEEIQREIQEAIEFPVDRLAIQGHELRP
jgi:hypothetical protein